MNVHNGQVEGKNKEAVVSTHHRPQVRVVEDVAIVVHRKAVPIHTKLRTDIGREVKKAPYMEEPASQFRQQERPFLPPPEVLQCVGSSAIGGRFSDVDIQKRSNHHFILSSQCLQQFYLLFVKLQPQLLLIEQIGYR